MDRLEQNPSSKDDSLLASSQLVSKPASHSPSAVPFPDISVVELIHNSKTPIYLAYSKAANRQFIMKTFKFEDDAISRKYLHESRFSSLSHQNIIPILGKVDKQISSRRGQTFAVSYILQEVGLCDFNELINLVEMGSDEALARTYFHQLIDGVEYLHSQQIAHLDLKPENFLLGQDYMLKITDFDLSYKQGDESIRGKGTVNYRSPELREKRCLNPCSSDVYSLGVILFVMRMGYLPYFENESVEGNNLQELMLNDIEEFWKAHKMINKRSEFSMEFKELFASMVSIDSNKRISLAEVKKSTWFNGKTYSVAELSSVIAKKVNGGTGAGLRN